MEIVAQLVGILGMIANLLSYQQKKHISFLLFQLFGNGLFFVNFLLLGIVDGVFYIGALMNVLGVVRAVVFANKKLFGSDKPIWILIFSLLYVISYVLTFTVFGTETTVPNLLKEFIPVIAMVVANFAMYVKDAGTARKLSLISSPSWLIYDISAKSLGGTIGEVLNLCSIFIGMLRHDVKKKGDVSNEE